DHVVSEYWHAAEERWILVDAQFDEAWRKALSIDHDILDVPRSRFLIAADAWSQCRAGNHDSAKFGIVKGNLRGLWFVAANLVHDVATLNKVELLRWDAWGAMPRPDQSIEDDQLKFFDRLAALTSSPDKSFGELRRLYKTDDGLRVPKTVFNSLLNQRDVVLQN